LHGRSTVPASPDDPRRCRARRGAISLRRLEPGASGILGLGVLRQLVQSWLIGVSELLELLESLGIDLKGAALAIPPARGTTELLEQATEKVSDFGLRRE